MNVIVKPIPNVAASGQTICSGTASDILLTTPNGVGGVTYAWTVSATNASGASASTGVRIAQTLTSTDGINDGTVNYSVTPTANGCPGTPVVATVTVQPTVTVNAGADRTVCEAPGSTTSIALTGTIVGGTSAATWISDPGNTGSISGTTISGSSVTATYTANAADISRGYVDFKLQVTGPSCGNGSDDLRVLINRRATVTPLVNYTACEAGSLNVSGTIGGSATAGTWSRIVGAGSVSSSTVLGTTVSTNYTLGGADVGSSITLRLTTNDPDGAGPCTVTSGDVIITINPSAKVNAGPDFEVCQDKLVELNGSFSSPSTSVTWSGGSGPSHFTNVNDPMADYTLTPADIVSGSITFTLTTNDPDGAGPCAAGTDQVVVKINKLDNAYIFGLDDAYAENGGPDFLTGIPAGGVYTGPGIVGTTNEFRPADAGLGNVVIRYTYTNPTTGCVNFAEDNTIVNPVTDVDFYILEDNRQDANGFLFICADQGQLTLVGIPTYASKDFSTTKFTPLSPALVPRVFPVAGTTWVIDTDNLPAGLYQLSYTYVNEFNVANTITKNLTVYAAPTAVIDAGNSCFGSTVTFLEDSKILDPENENPSNPKGTINKWTWLYGEGGTGSTGPIAEPVYQYLTTGTKSLSLTVETDQGCHGTTTKSIIVGTPPKVSFSWADFCKGDVTKIKDETTIASGSIAKVAWDFGDGDALAMAPWNDPVPPGQHGGRTSHTWSQPYHQYGNFDEFYVTLTVETNAGCTGMKKDTIYIQDYRTLTDFYREDFNAGNGTWVAESGKSSWIFGIPDGNVIHKSDNAWWTGGNSETYYANEQSYVIGPCLDLTQIKRPMVSLTYKSDVKEGYDGAVLQYSLNNGSAWITLGNAEGNGINWYNRRNIIGKPGGNNSYAWSELEGAESTPWKTARYNLDEIPVAQRNKVIFRMAFGSSADGSNGVLNGFAFDDIYIGEKRRNVLIEHFTSTSNASLQTSENYVDQSLRVDPTLTDLSDFNKIQYHMSIPGDDPYNKANPQDVDVRKLLYAVTAPPVTFMDGISGNYFGKNFNGFTGGITKEDIDRRSLEDPSFDINITIDETTSADLLKANVQYNFIDLKNSFTSRIILQAALVDDGGTGAYDFYDHKYPLRKLLYGLEGFVINDPLTAGVPATFSRPIEYPITTPLTTGDDLYIVAFAQEKDSRRILQSVIKKITQHKQSRVPLGLADDPAVAALHDLKIYPNPASKEIKLFMNEKLSRDYGWKIIDQRGVTLLQGDVNRDLTVAQSIDINRLADGIYFMAIQTGTRTVIYEKIAVMNGN